MKRIVWIAATILIMLGIMGYGLYTLNHIDEVNQRRREKEAGEKLASQFAETTATTSIWDVLRATTEEGEEATESGESFQDENASAPDEVSTEQEDSNPSTAPAPEPEAVVPETENQPLQQTTTTTTNFVIHMD